MCDLQVDPQGLATLSPYRLPNHRPCMEQPKYRANFQISPEQIMTASVCIDHANEARYPYEMWRVQNPDAHVPVGTRFVPCTSMWLIPPVDVQSLGHELSMLAYA